MAVNRLRYLACSDPLSEVDRKSFGIQSISARDPQETLATLDRKVRFGVRDIRTAQVELLSS